MHREYRAEDFGTGDLARVRQSIEERRADEVPLLISRDLRIPAVDYGTGAIAHGLLHQAFDACPAFRGDYRPHLRAVVEPVAGGSLKGRRRHRFREGLAGAAD